jgi:hypothetical protein
MVQEEKPVTAWFIIKQIAIVLAFLAFVIVSCMASK